MSMEQIPAGTLVLITNGCYSDYGVVAVTRATQNLDPDGLLNEWLADHPGRQRDDSHYEFVASLVSRGLLEELTHTEWHLGLAVWRLATNGGKKSGRGRRMLGEQIGPSVPLKPLDAIATTGGKVTLR